MIRYLQHAREAMVRRGIDPTWVEAALAAPDWTEPDPGHPGRTCSFRATSEIGGRVLRVVHWRDGPDVVVLMAHPDRDAAKRRPKV
ncbi:DUF4258 domain-containing protein [Siccirubricoccus sp. G192]|uniref:DUF4258 domain-containing protein n=1 Tax=Siccirubricoccus sp. G192 TaxID=2849651 RepID=UPI001C2C06DE|nr:DUF4258 domain-containing protein [Siccirubricoccus sp. G192]MBV1800367.1 DUF4258 domain-containing protein [Siccirubricoccus sp. G192]